MTNEAARKQRKLGRGLSTLMQPSIPIEVRPAPPADDYRTTRAPTSLGADRDAPVQVVSLDLDRVHPSPYQPRSSFDDGELGQLAESIRRVGVIQPVLVRPVPGESGVYELVAGERRWRAARVAGLVTISAIVVSLDDERAAEWALVENLQRTDLNTMERARALRGLAERFGLSQGHIAERVGLDRSSVANLIRLTDLEEAIQEMIEAGALSAGHGKALLGIDDREERLRVARLAASEGWSVRRVESCVRKGGGVSDVGPSARVASPTLVDLERRLGEFLGTRVRIITTRDGTRGRVSLEFYSLDHFDGLMQKMGFDGGGD